MGEAIHGEPYLKPLQTFSIHRAMPEPGRSRFLEEIAEIVRQMETEVIREYETVAFLARKVAT